ncbi:unnamed protein product, partial [Didymodactylos carnosus]
MYGGDSPLNLVRADFSSLKHVEDILNETKIYIGQMKYDVRPYYQPVRVNKCMKCFSHEHRTIQCNKPQICIRCGLQHPFTNLGCTNPVKCVNCQGEHSAGHPSCPVVQQKRRLLAERPKINRAELLVRKSQLQRYNTVSDYNDDVPAFSPSLSSVPPVLARGSYAAALKQPQQSTTTDSHQVELILSSFTTKIEQTLYDFEFRMTTQICELEKNIDENALKMTEFDNIVYNIVLPCMQLMTNISFENTCHPTTKKD